MQNVLPLLNVYPETDGKPVTENSRHNRLCGLLFYNLEHLYRDDPNVFVATNMFWYAVQGDPKKRIGPDIMLAFGPTKGDRSSYLQWNEGGVAPQVSIEIRSPGNSDTEILRRFRFCQRYGVEELIVHNPDGPTLEAWVRRGDRLRQRRTTRGFTSPRMGVRFTIENEVLRVYGPDGRPFPTHAELVAQNEANQQRALQAEQRVAALAELLRQHGIEPPA